MRLILLATLALFPACAHRQVVTHTSLDYNNDGCTDAEMVTVNLGALPDGTSTVAVELGANDQRRFSEQFRPVEGTQCLAVFTTQWGENMPWDSMDLVVEGSGWDKWFRREFTISPTSPVGQICLNDAWGRRDMELQVSAYMRRQNPGEDQPVYHSATFRIPPYGPSSFADNQLSIHFTEMVGLSPWSPKGQPSTSSTVVVPVDFTFTAQGSPGTWKEVDPNWHFSWEKPECLAKQAARAQVAEGMQ